MNRTLFAILFMQLFLCSARAQDFNGKNLKWRLPESTDARFKAFFGSNGSSFGSEGSSLVVENLTQNKLIVKCKVTIFDFCGNSQVKDLSRTVNPLATAGTSTWFDGFNYNTSCTEKKKWADNFYSKIQRVIIEVVSVQEIMSDKPVVTGNTNNNNSSEGKAVAVNCNAGLPRIMISEAGEYYAKASDGSYKKITREMYEAYKSKTNEEEKEKYIQDCTGRPQIRLKVPNMNQ